MNVSFNFLSSPLSLSPQNPCVLCIENRVLMRNVFAAFYNEQTQQEGILFWQNETELKYKGNVCFVTQPFDLKPSASVMKKLYENLALFCNAEMISQTLELKTVVLDFFETLVHHYDYDFEYAIDFSLADLFKMQDLRPNLSNEDLPQSLLSYLLFLRQYAGIKCFVLPYLHSFLTESELEQFYKETAYRDICLLVLEGEQNFSSLVCEKISVVDADLCEILAI